MQLCFYVGLCMYVQFLCIYSDVHKFCITKLFLRFLWGLLLAFSDLRAIDYGVSQGSNLGPLLFLIYINDLPNVSPIVFFILFADDTNVFYSHSSLQTLTQVINTELTLVADWFSANRLTLNLDKTNFILFKSHRKMGPSDDSLRLSINGIPIIKVTSTKFLGVHVDQHLTWKEHIKLFLTKLLKTLVF